MERQTPSEGGSRPVGGPAGLQARTPAPRPRLPEPGDGRYRMTSVVVTTDALVRVVLGGEIDQDCSHELLRTLDTALRLGDVEVDMAEVSFCDSAGLTVLLEARRRGASAGHSLTLCAGSSRVVHLLELTDTLPVLWPDRASRADGPPPRPVRPDEQEDTMGQQKDTAAERPPEHGATETHTVKGGRPVAVQRSPEHEEHQGHREPERREEREED